MYSVNPYSAIMTRADQIIAVSNCVRDYVLKNFEVAENKLTVIQRGVDIDALTSLVETISLEALREGLCFLANADDVSDPSGFILDRIAAGELAISLTIVVAPFPVGLARAEACFEEEFLDLGDRPQPPVVLKG